MVIKYSNRVINEVNNSVFMVQGQFICFWTITM